jgi:outer membrane lipoprotein-sorting protein
MRTLRILFVVTISLALASFVSAQEKTSGKMTHKKAEISDSAYTAQALSAAPKPIAKDAGVVRMDADGKMRTLRESKNGFTCMVISTDKMCNDTNSMEFFGAMMKGETPTDKMGISYMLAGDQGASNTDPKATH